MYILFVVGYYYTIIGGFMSQVYSSVVMGSEAQLVSKLSVSFKDSSVVEYRDVVEALSYVATHNTEILFCLIKYGFVEEQKLLSLLNKINEINPFIAKIIYDVPEDFSMIQDGFIKRNNIIVIEHGKSDRDVVTEIEHHTEFDPNNARRRFSRVSWPLKVKIEFAGSSRESLTENVLSVSCSGAYVSSATYIPKEKDQLDLTISFKLFKLFTNAEVVWVNDGVQKPDLPKGFAVEFVNIGAASQKVMDDIIKDEIVKKVLVDFER